MCEEEMQLFRKLKEFEDIFHDVESGIMSYREGIETIKEVIEELVSNASMREKKNS